MSEERVTYDTGEEVENWPEMMIGPLLVNLKPCPFCGSDQVEYWRENISDEHRVECGNCNLVVLFDVDLTDEQAIIAWNRREANA